MKKALYQITILGLFLALAVFAGQYNPNCQGGRYNANNNTFDCYKPPGTTNGSPNVQVNEWSDQFCVKNNNVLDLLLPTETLNEMSLFKSAAASINANVTQGACGSNTFSAACAAAADQTNSTITFSTTPSGGTAPYTYNWTGAVTGTTQSVTSGALAAGTYSATVTVHDSASQTATCSSSATLGPPNTGGMCPQEFTEGGACTQGIHAPFTWDCTDYAAAIPSEINQEPSWGPNTKSNAVSAYHQMVNRTPSCQCGHRHGGCGRSCDATIGGQTFHMDSETTLEVSCNGGPCGHNTWSSDTVLSGPNEENANCSL